MANKSALKSSTFVLALLPFFQQAYAQQCSINLNYGVIIDPKHIRIVDKAKTQVTEEPNTSTRKDVKGTSRELKQLLVGNTYRRVKKIDRKITDKKNENNRKCTQKQKKQKKEMTMRIKNKKMTKEIHPT